MEKRVDHEINSTHRLYEASMRGCVATLNTLIQTDPFALHKVSLTSFSETPLHISALLGHLDFTKALLIQKPELAKELDSFKRSPLHLASAEGHKEIVKELLLVNKDVCSIADQEGRIPLHLAAMRGRVEVIHELISAKPQSVSVKLHEDTVLHLCVRYNHLEALKLLLFVSKNDGEFLNSKNHEGETILQLSATLKQLETINYLLSVRPQLRLDVNSFIETAFAACDISRNSPFQNNLQKLDHKRTIDARNSKSPKVTRGNSKKEAHPAAKSINKLTKLLKYQSDWYEKLRGNLMVVATLIASVSFQVATNPPGGSWDEDKTNQTNCGPNERYCKAGIPIHAYGEDHRHNISTPFDIYTLYYYGSDYHIFMTFSTLSFSASLAIILLLISGAPFRNRISVGILIIGMWLTVVFLAITYYFSIKLVQVPGDAIFHHITHYYPKVWIWLLFAIILINVLQFFWWLLKKLVNGVIHAVRCCCRIEKTADKSEEEPMHMVEDP